MQEDDVTPLAPGRASRLQVNAAATTVEAGGGGAAAAGEAAAGEGEAKGEEEVDVAATTLPPCLLALSHPQRKCAEVLSTQIRAHDAMVKRLFIEHAASGSLVQRCEITNLLDELAGYSAQYEFVTKVNYPHHWHGARFSTRILHSWMPLVSTPLRTRGCHWFPRLLLEAPACV
jgi:hypothetical protein